MRESSAVPVVGEPAETGDETNVLFELWRLARAVDALLAGPLGEAGMSGDEFGVYSVLASASGAITPRGLAEWMSAPPTTVSSYIRRLESRGHLVRRPDPTDGRGVRLSLTAAGRRAFRSASATYQPVLADVRQRLGGDEPDVLAALATLRSAIGRSID